jgi:YhcH/YjgK/YiaL family protein
VIAASLRDIAHQVVLSPDMRKGIEFLRRPDLAEIADGTVEIEGKRVFAIVQRYNTVIAEHPRFEYHRTYIDIQYILAGNEMIGWIPAVRMSLTDVYDADKDIAFGSAPAGTWSAVQLQAGDAAIFYPEDAHAPRLAASAPAPVVKIVVKVLA